MSLKFNSDIIENYKTIHIPLTFLASSQVMYSINNIEFNPDEMIVNSISVFDVSANGLQNAQIGLLKSSLVNNYVMASIPNYNFANAPAQYLPYSMKLDTSFKINTSVNSNYLFYLTDLDGSNFSQNTANLNVYVVIMVTFYKYKSLDIKENNRIV